MNHRITLLLTLALSACPVTIAGDERPEFSIYQARVKQHRQGAQGDLVEGEE
eukprot:CAMPEP_0185810934 /NCGR_PEP_ID=MMETSP1322-20130828/7193_1 /TAXON_ID=265543 /ORGANISM="Minutocellus polymorphus, Strain RCC2270" /LENGTH=51 /DNA_ID=CAMNT_0028507271 /DNA_START=66 /DNA_END=218 /DNA_ORIENTATION=+